MIKLRDVSKIYQQESEALRDVDLDVIAGEFVSIVGQSGTGKTTLVKLLIAEEKPDKGKIEIGGWDISRIKRREVPILRRQLGVVFQDFKLLDQKTVFENVAFASEVCGSSIKEIRAFVPQALKVVGLEKMVDRYPAQLSGGERQRVAIARALIHRPKLLIADEPTGNLDSINANEIIDLLLKINNFGTTVVLVTHNRDIVNGLKKRVITMDNGVIINDQKVGRYVL